MVSLQASHSMEEKKREKSSSTKKRKKEEPAASAANKGIFLLKEASNLDSVSIELNLDFPLPSEWQRCLDIQSGEIHFYNTKTKRRTCKDPRSLENPSPPPTLDLELNLMFNPSESIGHGAGGLKVDNAHEHGMVAACARCHMLVMMCKASPSCPNCKFAHSPELHNSSIKSLRLMN